MNLTLDPNGPFTIGDQLVQQLRALILAGTLEPGAPLPSARDLAAQLGVNLNTVGAAYRRLEQDGYLVRRRRAGTRVSDDPPRPVAALLAARLTAPLAATVTDLGLDAGEVAGLLVAQCASGAGAPRPRVAALAETPLAADAVAARARALLGDAVEIVPRTVSEYRSGDHHLTLIDPGLSRALERGLRPDPPLGSLGSEYLQYSPEFPAGAD